MSETGEKYLSFVTDMLYASLLSAIMQGPEQTKTAVKNLVQQTMGLVGDIERRRQEAIELAVRYGGIDGDHHKAWVIDQMVRKLAADDYERVVAEARKGEDGPHTYDWDEGIPP